MAIESVKPVPSVDKPIESQASAASSEKVAEGAARFGPAYILEPLHGEATPQDGAAAVWPSKGDTAKNSGTPGAVSGVARKNGSDASNAESVQRAKTATKPSRQQMSVPFTPSSLGKTLAALPPMNPIGAASLTRLSLVKMLEGANPKDTKVSK